VHLASLAWDDNCMQTGGGLHWSFLASVAPRSHQSPSDSLEAQRNTLPINEASPGYMDHPGEAGWG